MVAAPRPVVGRPSPPTPATVSSHRKTLGRGPLLGGCPRRPCCLSSSLLSPSGGRTPWGFPATRLVGHQQALNGLLTQPAFRPQSPVSRVSVPTPCQDVDLQVRGWTPVRSPEVPRRGRPIGPGPTPFCLSVCAETLARRSPESGRDTFCRTLYDVGAPLGKSRPQSSLSPKSPGPPSVLPSCPRGPLATQVGAPKTGVQVNRKTLNRVPEGPSTLVGSPVGGPSRRVLGESVVLRSLGPLTSTPLGRLRRTVWTVGRGTSVGVPPGSRSPRDRTVHTREPVSRPRGNICFPPRPQST